MIVWDDLRLITPTTKDAVLIGEINRDRSSISGFRKDVTRDFIQCVSNLQDTPLKVGDRLYTISLKEESIYG